MFSVSPCGNWPCVRVGLTWGHMDSYCAKGGRGQITHQCKEMGDIRD